MNLSSVLYCGTKNRPLRTALTFPRFCDKLFRGLRSNSPIYAARKSSLLHISQGSSFRVWSIHLAVLVDLLCFELHDSGFNSNVHDLNVRTLPAIIPSDGISRKYVAGNGPTVTYIEEYLNLLTSVWLKSTGCCIYQVEVTASMDRFSLGTCLAQWMRTKSINRNHKVWLDTFWLICGHHSRNFALYMSRSVLSG